MEPRLCEMCGDRTRNWYVNNEHGHPQKGALECATCHEMRINRETIDRVYAADIGGDSWMRSGE